MRRDLMNDRDFKKVRLDIYTDFSEEDCQELYSKLIKLRRQYKLFKISKFIENIYIPVINIFFIHFIFMLLDFLRWKFYDLLIFLINGKKFNFFGVSCFCGRQGSGKTIGVVREVERIKAAYPECITCTNVDYVKQDVKLTSWLQLLELRNGEKGVIFVIDEIQNQGLDWNNFPTTLLAVITQQRKQKIKIFVTAQVYKTVPIQIRRQCFDVIECKTFFGRWTRYKCYDAEEYNNVIDTPTPEKKFRLPKKYKDSFIQSNYIRKLYDTSQVISALKDFDLLCSDERTKNIENKEKSLLTGYTILNGNKKLCQQRKEAFSYDT